MRIPFLPCFCILLFAVAVTNRASEISHTSKNRDVHVSEHLAGAPERNSESAVANISDNSKVELATKNFIPDVEKNQRGKGSNGGGSIARQPRTIRNSAVTLKRPSISMSTTDFMSSLLLFLVLPFVIP
ncbi:uncharacterized protein [Nicotiana sylvestris]|uniref:uncharacterized protein n=1 Tax=Nicotiana sylvestris TaxID=4096 RepID=UPI00388CA85A